MLAALDRSGWRVEQVADVDTGALQDADWEIAMALNEAPEGLAKELLRQVARKTGNSPLPAYVVGWTASLDGREWPAIMSWLCLGRIAK